jgi:uncharacterized protein
MRCNLSKTWVSGLLFALTILVLLVQPSAALEVPALKGRVNDYAGILAPSTARQLEEVLRQFEAAESTQIVLLTVPSLEGESLENFSLRVAEAWKPGQAKLDNGALLLIAKNDRQLRIEVGYGLEGKLTDLITGRIIRDIITPRFKEGNFDQGVMDGLTAMIAAAKGEFTPATTNRHPNSTSDSGNTFIFLLILFSFLGRILAKVPWLSAGVGAVIAGVFGATFLGVGIAGIVGLALAGFLFGLIAAKFSAAAGAGMSSRYGGWGGSSGGGFSGGLGGFSGGGGSFGGGGSSGRW